MFSKRHYQAIALAMQSAKPVGETAPGNAHGRAHQWEYDCNVLADTFERDNGLFKRDLFLRACQPGANVRKRV